MREETTNTSGQGRHLRPPHFVSTLSAVLLVFTGLLSTRSYAAVTDSSHEGRSPVRGITPFVQDTLREAEGLTFTFDADVPAASEATEETTEEATAPTATPETAALLPIADSTSGNGSAPLPGLDLESAFDASAPLAADTLTNATNPETFQPELLGDLTALPEPADPAPDAGSIAPSDPAPAGSSQLSITDATYRQVIREGAQSLSCHLTYPQGRAAVLPDFEGNASELRRLDDFVRQVYRDSLIYVNSIRLCGYCSIEGSYRLNERLARSRVEGFRQYLDEKYGLSEHYTVNVDWVPEDWATLREMVDTSRMENRRDVVFLIDHMDIFEGREKKLMDLRGGVPYKYMLKHLFPALRRVEIVVEYDLRRIMEEKLQRKLDEEEFAAALEAERRAAEAEERRLEAERQAAEQARLEAARRAAEQARLEAERQAAEAARLEAERRAAEAARLEAERQAVEAARLEAERRAALRAERRESRKLRPLFALKTDLVAWSGLRPDSRMRTFMPNLEGELYFAGRWSVSATGLYANWSYDGGREFWGLSSYSVEPRFWIRRDGLFRGLFVGLYGEVGDFNNQQGRVDGQTTLDNYTGTYWSAGLAAGYLVPLSRHWSVELALRGGYRSVDYDRYDRELPYLYYSGSGTQQKFALTGLRLSIVYRFGRVGQ